MSRHEKDVEALTNALYRNGDLGPGYLLHADCKHLAEQLLALDFIRVEQVDRVSLDRDALDKIAVGLSTKPEWSSEELDWIARILQSVRPFDGEGMEQAEYLAWFKNETGRDAEELYPEYVYQED